MAVGLATVVGGAGVVVPVLAAAAAGVFSYYMSRNDGAQYVTLKYDPKLASFENALEVARHHATDGVHLLYVGIRRVDAPGHPWVCEWTRRTPKDSWEFTWKNGATHEQAASAPPEFPAGPDVA
jgi:hypothetical protein